jgi:serine protease Do
MKRLVIILGVLVILYLLVEGSNLGLAQIQRFLPATSTNDTSISPDKTTVVTEKSDVVDVVKKVGPSVVTIGFKESPRTRQNPTRDPFSFFFGQEESPEESDPTPGEQYIGSGFVIRRDGLVVTNKHVVSDADLDYIVIDDKGTQYEIDRIYRDPANDLAILHVTNPPRDGFPESTLGDSSKLQVGQLAIAIGTALGEFRNTVTTGVVSGLGRGVTAGSPFEGAVERLDNVIQTDAAINPGNSGGPLLNAAGQVIGVNTAVSRQGQNIGFAIPINIVKDSLKTFNETGEFNRPFLGVSYLIINRQTAIRNDLVEGAYVQEVVEGSSAERAGVRAEDIITKIDNEDIRENTGGLATVISKKKIGDQVTLTINRDGETITLPVTLQAAPNQ